MPRPKGIKNRTSVCMKANKVYPVRLDMDLYEYVQTKPNKNEYFNDVVRRDYEEYLIIKKGMEELE